MKYSDFSVTACSIVALMQACGIASTHPLPPLVRAASSARASDPRGSSSPKAEPECFGSHYLWDISPGPRSAPPLCKVRPRSVPACSRSGWILFRKVPPCSSVTLKKSNSVATSWFQNSWALLASFLAVFRIWEEVLKPKENLDRGWKSKSIFESFLCQKQQVYCRKASIIKVEKTFLTGLRQI